MTQARRLYKSVDDKMISGVSGGMAEYFDIDPVLARAAWVAAAIVSGGVAIIAYIAMAIIMPKYGDPRYAWNESRRSDEASEYDADSSERAADWEETRRERRHRAGIWLASALIVVGCALLIDNLGIPIFYLVRWDIVVPIGMIAVGLAVLLTRLRG